MIINPDKNVTMCLYDLDFNPGIQSKYALALEGILSFKNTDKTIKNHLT